MSLELDQLRIFKQKVYQNYLRAKTIRQPEAQIKFWLRNIDKCLEQGTPGLVHQKLDFARSHDIEKNLKPLF